MPGPHQHQEHVGTRRKVRRLVANDQRPELLLTLFNRVAQHFNDALVDGVHLGMKLDTRHTVSQVDERGRAIIAQYLIAGLQYLQ